MPTTRELMEELKREAGVTRKVLERIPPDRFDWRPHEKSWAFGQLGSHITSLYYWLTEVLSTTGVDLEGDRSESFEAADVGQLLERFDSLVEKSSSVLEQQSEESFSDIWTLRSGEHVIFELPRSAALRFFVFNHLVHHRGQLTMYLRLCDVPLPAVYGPSADEQS